MSMVTKITMPSIGKATPPRMETCVLYLARENDEPDHVLTVIKGHDGGVIYFDTDDSICHSSEEYFNDAYELIRKYNPGETLSITV